MALVEFGLAPPPWSIADDPEAVRWWYHGLRYHGLAGLNAVTHAFWHMTDRKAVVVLQQGHHPSYPAEYWLERLAMVKHEEEDVGAD